MPLVSKAFGDIITFTRASTGTYFDSAGVLQSAAINAPRLDYNPATLAAQGLLIEEQRTNSIRNNTMQGAVAGTPGTAPTNWSIPTPSGGLSAQVIGTGTENGVTYIDVRYSGTATSTAIVLSFDTSTQIAALNGQNWAGSLWIKNITSAFDNYNLRISLRDSGGAALASIDTLIVPTTTLARFSGSGTLANASVAFVQPQLRLGITVGVAYDVTFRIGLPQLELGAFATSVIPTTTTALTRSADVASVNTLSPWYNATEGTLYVQALRGGDVDATIATFAIGSTTADRIQIHSSTSSEYRATYRTGNVEQAALLLSSSTNSPKIAATIKTNDLAASINGASPQTDTTASIAAYDTLWIGRRSDADVYWNGHIQRITYYPRAFPAAELPALTA